MAIVFKNLSGGNGGSKLYKHDLHINYQYAKDNMPNEHRFSIITNFDTELNDNNITDLLCDYYKHSHGCLVINEHTSTSGGTDINILTIGVFKGDYVGSTTRHISINADQVCTSEDGTMVAENKQMVLGNDGIVKFRGQSVEMTFVQSDVVTPL